MIRESVKDFEQNTPLSFLFFTSTFLECLDILKKNNNGAEEREDDTEHDCGVNLKHQSDGK